MTTSTEKPVVCPVLIGRASPLGSLTQLLDDARAGRGHVALLAGEAGVGKSRLVAETRARAAADGMCVLQGNCFEPVRALPYAPISDLLRKLPLGREEVVRLLGAGNPLGRLLPELASSGEYPPIAASDQVQEQQRLFHAVSQLLNQLASARPLLVVVEDLHWSDEVSLECLLYLTRQLAPARILLLLTYRSDEPQPTLNHFLAELDRDRSATELELSRLTVDETDAMIRAIFDQQHPVRPEFLSSMYELTEGNPFFVEEVLKSLVAGGDIYYADGQWDRKPVSELHIPRSVQDAVHRRSSLVSPEARTVLTLAAVIGRRCDFALLESLTQMDEERLLQSLKELIAAQLIVEESSEQFAFRHALTREAIYSGLLARERRARHRAIAETLEQLYAGTLDAHLIDLAYHSYKGEVWEKALAYCQVVGERAYSFYAPRAAAELFSRSLTAAHHLAVVPAPELYRLRGRAYETLGDFEPARLDFETALAAARAGQDRRLEWQVLVDLGRLWAGRDYTQTGDYYQRAFELATALDDPSLLARSLNWVGNWLLNIDQPREALLHHQQALAILEDLDDQQGIAETLDLLGVSCYMCGNLVEGTAYYQRAVAFFERLGERSGLVSTLATMTMRSATYQSDTMVCTSATLAESTREGELAVRYARESGQRSAEAYARVMLAFCLGAQGEYTRALEEARAGLRIAEEIEHRQWQAAAHCALGVLYLDLLDLEAARQEIQQGLSMAREIGSMCWTRRASGYLASTYLQQHELPGAEAVLTQALEPDTPLVSCGQRLAWCAQAELALAHGTPELALRIVEQLAGDTEDSLSGEQPILRLSRLRGEALAALGRLDQAEAALRAALLVATQQGALPAEWRIHVALGELQQIRSCPAEALRSFAAARDLIEQLAARVPDEALREGFRRNAAARLPAALRPRPNSSSEADRLTPREREVAALIAEGKSNHDIAEILVTSERTVESHVRNILAKLNAASRSQIAVWFIENADPR